MKKFISIFIAVALLVVGLILFFPRQHKQTSRNKPDKTKRVVSLKEFFVCIRASDAEKVKWLLDSCTNLEELLAAKFDGRTPLGYAVYHNKHQIVRCILEKAPNLQALLEIKATSGSTAFHDIVSMEVDEKIVQEIVALILNKVENPDKLLITKNDNSRWTSLHQVIFFQKDNLLPLMLAKAKDKKQIFTIEDNSHYTILHTAFANGSVKAANIILNSLAEEDMMDLLNRPNSNQYTPKEVATQRGDRHILTALFFASLLSNPPEEEMLEGPQPHLALAEEKDCIVLLSSNTNTGQSTLANAMSQGSGNMQTVDKYGKILENPRSHDGDVYLQSQNPVVRDGNIVFEVRIGSQSVTQYPEVADLSGKMLCDCPGFWDKKELEKDILNQIAIGNLLKHAKRVKLCFLFSETALRNDSPRLRSVEAMLPTLSCLFKRKDNKDMILGEDLQKVQIVLTRPDKKYTKRYAIEILEELLNKALPGREDAITTMLNNVMFVDAADRAYQFADAKKSSGGEYSSPSQDRVEDLVDKVCSEDDRWFGPEEFRYPMEEQTKVGLKCLWTHIRSRVYKLISNRDNSSANAIQGLLNTLEKLNHYHFFGLDVSAGIQVIEKYKRKINANEAINLDTLQQDLEQVSL